MATITTSYLYSECSWALIIISSIVNELKTGFHVLQEISDKVSFLNGEKYTR